MEWKIKRDSTATNIFKDELSYEWKYISKEELYNRYPNGGYRIVGDLRKKHNADYDEILITESSRVFLYPYCRRRRKVEKVVGYIELEDYPDYYVRILKKSYFKFILFLLTLFILAGVFFLGMWMSNKDKVPGLDEASVSYRVEGMENIDPEIISLPGISVITAKAGESEVKYPLQNPIGNECYMKYRIIDINSDEVLYESGLIEPGTAITSFQLTKSFSEGEYRVLIEVDAFDINDYKKALNGGEMEAILRVQ